VTYYIWYTNSSVFNSTTILVTGNQTNSTSLFIDEFGLGANYIWNTKLCGVNSTSSICIWGNSNYSFYNLPFLETSTIYNGQTTETARETYRLNISANSNINAVTGSFYYNGTRYSTTINDVGGGNYSVVNTIDVPLPELPIL